MVNVDGDQRRAAIVCLAADGFFKLRVLHSGLCVYVAREQLLSCSKPKKPGGISGSLFLSALGRVPFEGETINATVSSTLVTQPKFPSHNTL